MAKWARAARRRCAVIVDPATVADLDQIRKPQGMGSCRGFKHDINEYLAAQGARVPGEEPHGNREERQVSPERPPPARASRTGHGEWARLAGVSGRHRVPRTVSRGGDEADGQPEARRAHLSHLEQSAAPDRRPEHASRRHLPGVLAHTGFPAIQVPMGYSRGDRLPAGLTFFGRAWSESTLINLAYGYEQATHHRRAPASTPPLR